MGPSGGGFKGTKDTVTIHDRNVISLCRGVPPI